MPSIKHFSVVQTIEAPKILTKIVGHLIMTQTGTKAISSIGLIPEVRAKITFDSKGVMPVKVERVI